MTFALSEGLPAPMFQEHRGWSTGEWEEARMGSSGAAWSKGADLATRGRELRRSIEQTTDELAGPPFTAPVRDRGR